MNRCERKKKDSEKRKYNISEKIRKMLVFFAILFFFAGLFVVDDACSDMTGEESIIQIHFVRVDDENIKIAVLGQTFDVNTYLISSKIRTFLENANGIAIKTAGYIKNFFYTHFKHKKEIPFDAQIL